MDYLHPVLERTKVFDRGVDRKILLEKTRKALLMVKIHPNNKKSIRMG